MIFFNIKTISTFVSFEGILMASLLSAATTGAFSAFSRDKSLGHFGGLVGVISPPKQVA